MTRIALKYTLLPGDSFARIANALDACAGVSTQMIEQANPETKPTLLQLGQLLNIPKSNGETALRYTVLAGDSMSGIAAALRACAGVTYQMIEQANPGLTPTKLLPGQCINIPALDQSDDVPVMDIPVIDTKYIGYWNRTWSPGGAPSGVNIGIAFSGWTDPVTALQQSARVKNTLLGSKYISLGGGNENGAFTLDSLAAVTAAINAGHFSGYDGIAYDVEEGATGLAEAFQQSFAAAKAKQFKVLVTVSHSAPYGICDAAALMESFFADENVDFLSPQLYTTGDEPDNDYATTAGVQWLSYAKSKAIVVPSIVKASMFESAKAHFQSQSVAIDGFVQWSRSA